MVPQRRRRRTTFALVPIGVLLAALLGGCGFAFDQRAQPNTTTTTEPFDIGAAGPGAAPSTTIAPVTTPDGEAVTTVSAPPEAPPTTALDVTTLDQLCRQVYTVVLNATELGTLGIDATPARYLEVLDRLITGAEAVSDRTGEEVASAIDGLVADARAFRPQLEAYDTGMQAFSGLFTFSEQVKARLEPVLTFFDERCPVIVR